MSQDYFQTELYQLQTARNLDSQASLAGSCSGSKSMWITIIIVIVVIALLFWIKHRADLASQTAEEEGFTDSPLFKANPGFYNYTTTPAYKEGFVNQTPSDGPFDRFDEYQNYSQTAQYREGFVDKYDLKYKAPKVATIKSVGRQLKFDDQALMDMNNPVVYDRNAIAANYVGIEAFDRGGGEVHDNSARISDSMLMRDMLHNTGLTNEMVKQEISSERKMNGISPIGFKQDKKRLSLNYWFPHSQGMTARKVPVHPLRDGFDPGSKSKLLRNYMTK